MKLFKEHRILYTFICAISLWLILPLTTKTTGNANFIYASHGYTQIANFNKHHAPPKVGFDIYKQIVWKHERYSFFWLPFWGSKDGQFGLYTLIRSGKANLVSFVPLRREQAQKLAAQVNVKIENGSPVTYWSLYFGWLVLLPFALILFWDPGFYKWLKDHL